MFPNKKKSGTSECGFSNSKTMGERQLKNSYDAGDHI